MGNIEHIEIPSKNIDESIAFYTTVFGWTCRTAPEMDYAFFRTPDGLGGGFNPTGTPSDDGVIPYIEVEDIPAALELTTRTAAKRSA